jgi:hypothetical protein
MVPEIGGINFTGLPHYIGQEHKIYIGHRDELVTGVTRAVAVVDL